MYKYCIGENKLILLFIRERNYNKAFIETLTYLYWLFYHNYLESKIYALTTNIKTEYPVFGRGKVVPKRETTKIGGNKRTQKAVFTTHVICLTWRIYWPGISSGDGIVYKEDMETHVSRCRSHQEGYC